MTDPTQKFDYEVERVQFSLALVVVVAIPILLANHALTNDKGLRLFHIVTLSKADATNFWWGLAILCSLAALILIFSMLSSLRHPEQVELHPTYANLPKASIMGGQLDIPYETITKVSRRKIPGDQEMTKIKSSVGESCVISSHFNSMLAYEEFLSALSTKLNLTVPLKRAD